MPGGVGDEAHLLVLDVSDVVVLLLVLPPVDGQSPHHHAVHDLALLLLEQVPLVLPNTDFPALELAECLQYSLLISGLPILPHELLVSVRYGVQRGGVYFQQMLSDAGGVDFVIGQHPLGEVAELCFLLVCVPSQLQGELDLFLNPFLKLIVFQNQLPCSFTDLLLNPLLLRDLVALHRLNGFVLTEAPMSPAPASPQQGQHYKIYNT